MYRTTLSVLVFALGYSASATAAIRFDRDSTLTDATGGTMHTHSSGDFAADADNAVTAADFRNFAPREQGGSVNGSIQQKRDREGALVSLSYAGNLILNLSADSSVQVARTVNVSFEDLAVVRSEEGRTVAGDITINGRAMSAEEAPRSIIAVLIGLVRLMRV